MEQVKSLNRLEQLLRKYLNEKRMTVTQLADQLSISRVTIYNVFRGRFSRKLLNKIAKALEIPAYILHTAGADPSDDPDQELLRAYHTADMKIRKMVNCLLDVENNHHLAKKQVSKPKVIVVDDLQDNVDFFARSLRSDFEIFQFTDPVEALEAIRNTTDVAAVLTDQRMPVMKGTDLLNKVNLMGKTVAKLIISAYTDNQALIDAINYANVDAFLVKPVSANELRDRVHSLIFGEPNEMMLNHSLETPVTPCYH